MSHENYATIRINGMDNPVIINLQPLADMFNKTSCTNGIDLAKKINSVKDTLVLSFNDDGHLEIQSLRDAYYILTVLSETIQEFTIEYRSS